MEKVITQVWDVGEGGGGEGAQGVDALRTATNYGFVVAEEHWMLCCERGFSYCAFLLTCSLFAPSRATQAGRQPTRTGDD